MKSLGQIAYKAYFEACAGKSLISGQSLPQFGDQREDIKNAWEAAAWAARNVSGYPISGLNTPAVERESKELVRD